MLKKVRVQLVAKRDEIRTVSSETGPEVTDEKSDRIEFFTEGNYHDDGERVSIVYHESELTGMDGAVTTLSFLKKEPGLVSMLRNGTVRTALVFEEGRRHICIYETPFMPFEVTVETDCVQNRIPEDGTLALSYTVEIKGASAEHTDFRMTVLPLYKKPLTD